MVGFGAKKQILVVGNDGVQLYVTAGKRVSMYADYSSSGGSLGAELKEAFRTINAPLIILFDVVEQQYRKEAIPKVSTFDKNKVIQRKLMMAFPQQQFRAFIPLAQKPKDNESLVALFAGLGSSLTNTQIIDAVLSSEVSLLGAGLLPMESTKLVAALVTATHKRASTANDTRWSILMTQHKTGGLRQVIIKDGELALTRLTPLAIDAHHTNDLVEEMVREFNATLTYLSRFGYVANDGLDLIVVSSAEVAQAIREQRLAVTHLYPLSNQEAGKLIGVTPTIAPDDAVFGEILHAGWAGIQRKLLMPLSAQILDKVRQARSFARLGILVLFFGAAYIAWQDFNLQTQIFGLNSEIVEQKSRRIALQNEYDELSKKLNTLKYDPEKTRITLEVYDEYKKKGLDFEPTLTAINDLIDKSKIILKDIEIRALDMPADPNVPPADPNAPPPKPNAQIDFTLGFVESTAMEEAARQTNDLVDRLKGRFPGRKIEVTQMVGNLAIDQTVQGISEQVAQGKIEGRTVQEQTSAIRITGALQ